MLASPLATTSQVTLDSFLNEDQDKIYSFLNSERQDPWTAVTFAADDELLNAALAPAGEPTDGWLSPPAAYNGLRSSGLFSHYLQILLPRIRTLYANLKPSGMHQQVVSDLLLRNPDQRALREVLIEETQGHAAGDKLRSGLVAQIYTVIAPSIRQRTLAPLPRPALIAVSRAMKDEHHPDLMPDLFYQLAHSSDWAPHNVWPMLDISLDLAKHGGATSALRLLQYPIALGKLPSNALGRSSAAHPEAAALMAQSAVVRTAMAWGMDGRASRAVNDLIGTMVKSEVSLPALDLVYSIVRAAAVTREPEHIAWACRALLRLASEDHVFPPIPKPELDIVLDSLPTPAALQFYASLPVGRYKSPNPHHILRLALAEPSRPLLLRLVHNLVDGTDDAAAAVPGVLRALASARMLPIVRQVYERWAPGNLLDSRTTLSLVSAFTRGARRPENDAFARSVLSDYLNTKPPVVLRAVTALHAHTMLQSALEVETPYVETLTSSLGVAGATECLQQFALKYPLLSHRLQQVVKGHGIELPTPAVAIAAACVSRRWGVLAAYQRKQVVVLDCERPVLDALVVARKGRMSAAADKYRAAAEAHPNEAVLIPAAGALLHRASVGNWAQGLDILCSALEHAPVSGEGGDALVEHACVFLSALRRFGTTSGEWRAQWASFERRIGNLADRLEPSPRTLLLAFVGRVSGSGV